MESFATLLRSYREYIGVSQSELARRAGISASYVNRLENSEREPPTRSVVLKIAQALELDPEAKDALLMAGRYAPTRPSMMPVEPPVFRLLADILQDERVPAEEIELLARNLEQIKRRWVGSNSDPASDLDGRRSLGEGAEDVTD